MTNESVLIAAVCFCLCRVDVVPPFVTADAVFKQLELLINYSIIHLLIGKVYLFKVIA